MAWSHYKSCHVQGSRADESLGVAAIEVAVGAMLAARDYHRQIVVAIAPSQNVHHRLCVAAVHGQRGVKIAE